jgi:hypothetical protein
MALRGRFTELPYPDFSLANIIRRRAPVSGSLVRGDNAYVPGKANNSDDAVKKQVQSALNKLAETNYAEILQQLQSGMLLEDTAITHFVHIIFQKSLQEPKYSPMYAQLCYDMAKFEVNTQGSTPSASPPSMGGEGGPAGSQQPRNRSKFRDAIVVRTQSEFQEEVDQGTVTDEDASKVARRKKANIKFVGQLFLRKVLSERIMFSVLNTVLRLDQEDYEPASIEIEVLTELLGTIGERLDASSDGFLNLVFERLNRLMLKTPQYESRIFFKIMDICDLRESNWVTREESRDSVPPQQRHSKSKPLMPLQSPKSMVTPVSKGAAFKFPDTPPTAGSVSSGQKSANSTPGSWRNIVKSSAPPGPTAKPAPAASPTVPIEKKIDEVFSEFGEGALSDWRTRFAGYNLTDENLAIGIVAKISTDACTTTNKEAQARAADFFTKGLQLSRSDIVTGLSKMIAKSIDEDLVSDTPKLNERFVALVGATCDQPTAQFTDVCAILFSALHPLQQGELVEEAVDSLMAVWRSLPKDVTVNPSVVDVVLRSRGTGSLPATLTVQMLKHIIVDNKIAPIKPLTAWAASPSGVAAKDFRAQLVADGVLPAQ